MYSLYTTDQNGEHIFDLGVKYQTITVSSSGVPRYVMLHTGVQSKSVAKQVMEDHGLRVVWMYDGEYRTLIGMQDCMPDKPELVTPF